MGLFDWLDTTPKMPTLDEAMKAAVVDDQVAAQNGDPVSQFRYGSACIAGKHTPKNEKLGFHWIMQSALQRHLEAQVAVGKVLMTGSFGINKDTKMASKILLAAIADHQTTEDKNKSLLIQKAISMLGYIFLKKESPDDNLQIVKDLLSLENIQSIPIAYYLGCIYASESHHDSSALSKAATCFAKMIEKDLRNTDSLSRTLNGHRIEAGYEDEEGNPIDLTDCLKIVTDAAKNGNDHAQFALGLVFINGWRGVGADIENARALISSAARLGNKTAIDLLSQGSKN